MGRAKNNGFRRPRWVSAFSADVFCALCASRFLVPTQSESTPRKPQRTQRVIVFALLCFLFCSSLPICAQTSVLGFTPSAAAHEIEIESKFKAIPSPDERAPSASHLYREPHVAGSKRNNELARYIADEWRQEGLEEVVIRRYECPDRRGPHLSQLGECTRDHFQKAELAWVP